MHNYLSFVSEVIEIYSSKEETRLTSYIRHSVGYKIRLGRETII